MRKFALLATLVVVMTAVAAPASATRPDPGSEFEEGHKITICHATRSLANPYVKIQIGIGAWDLDNTDDRAHGPDHHAREKNGIEWADYALVDSTDECAPGTVPNAPTQLHVKSRSGETVTMGIVDNATDETGFRIYLGGSLHKQVGANVTTFGINPELCTTVAVTVTAVNQYGESPTSNTINVNHCPSPSGAPSSLHLSAWNNGTASMGFTDNSGDEDGFRIYVNGSVYATLPVNVSTFTITPTPCETWSVFVRAFGSSGESTSTNTLNISHCP
jgi:hypothetical protein